MNSEELEQSLRTEFEDYLKQISADAQRGMSEFQEKTEAEFERHKTQLAEMFRDFSARAAVETQLDAGFRESIVEHLRLARDEGARITATAIAEAEDIEKEAAAANAAALAADAPPPRVGVAELRDAINDISSQKSQAAILKSLVSHAGQFAERGAFFIIKNEHFVGWRTFGSGQESENEAVREIFFPVSDSTTLGESVASLSAVEGAYGNYDGDAVYLEKLEFGKPEKMFAIPLVARGRGVAVLYADGGAEDATDNREKTNFPALETLVRIAGLTVEILAASTASPNVAKAAEEPRREFVPVQDAEKTGEQFGEETYSDAPQPEPHEELHETANARSFDEEQFNDSPMPVYNEVSAYGAEDAAEESHADSPSDLRGEEDVTTEAAANDYQSALENYDYSTENDLQPDVSQTNFDEYALDGNAEQSPVSGVDDEIQTIYQDAQTDSSATERYSWNQPAETGAQDGETHENQTPDDDSPQDFQTEAAKYDYPSSSFSSSTFVSDGEYSFENAQTFETENEQSFETAHSEFAETPALFETAHTIEPAQFESGAFDSTAGFGFDKAENYGSFEQPTTEEFAFKPMENPVEPATAATAMPTAAATTKPTTTRSRFSDKNVDLPIEVSEDERRLHNDARRFARLLVSEIKLYNEQKVKEGRASNDLYDRLREAVDRSREMYDKRVQQPVAAKFDYFHYELVNTLAEGDESNLGADYPGAAV